MPEPGAGLLIVTDENSKKDDGEKLEEEADCRELEPEVGCMARHAERRKQGRDENETDLPTSGRWKSEQASALMPRLLLMTCGKPRPHVNELPAGSLPPNHSTTPEDEKIFAHVSIAACLQAGCLFRQEQRNVESLLGQMTMAQ